MQYLCQVDDEELSEKRSQALIASCACVFSALVLLSVLKYRSGSIDVEKRLWDLQTVTASDYTLEIKLYPEQIAEIKRLIAYNNFMPYEADGLRFKLYLASKLDEIINEISGGEGGRVADINFAYQNSWLLDSLRLRGDYIKYHQWKQLNELNREMTRQLHESMEDVVTPVCAFVTMESETAYNHLSSVPSVNLFVKDSKVKEAVEPTNIIWENRDFNPLLRFGRLILIVIAVCVVLGVTFLATLYAK